MTREGEEIEVLAGNVDRPLEGTFGVAHGVVIVQVAPEEAEPIAVVRCCRLRLLAKTTDHCGRQRSADELSAIDFHRIHLMVRLK